MFRTWKESGWATHTLCDAKNQTATVSIARGNGQTAIASTTLYSAGGTVFPFVHQTNATSFSAAGVRRAAVRAWSQ